MRPQLSKVAYGLTAFLLTVISAIPLQQTTQTLDFYGVNSGDDFIGSNDSGLEPALIAGEPDGQACGTGTTNMKKLRVRQKTYCTEKDHQQGLNNQGPVESGIQPALSSQEQFPGASPGTITIPDSLPASYTQDHTGHEKLARYCPDFQYTAHLCCDGPLGPFEISSGAIQHEYVDFCQGRTFSLQAGPTFCTLFGLINRASSGHVPYLC